MLRQNIGAISRSMKLRAFLAFLFVVSTNKCETLGSLFSRIYNADLEEPGRQRRVFSFLQLIQR